MSFSGVVEVISLDYSPSEISGGHVYMCVFTQPLHHEQDAIFLRRVTEPLTKWIECLPNVWDTRFNPRLSHTKDSKKWSLMLPCLTFSIIRYRSRVKWSNPGNGVVPSPPPRCSSYWKGSFQVALNYGHQLYLLLLYNWFEFY